MKWKNLSIAISISSLEALPAEPVDLLVALRGSVANLHKNFWIESFLNENLRKVISTQQLWRKAGKKLEVFAQCCFRLWCTQLLYFSCAYTLQTVLQNTNFRCRLFRNPIQWEASCWCEPLPIILKSNFHSLVRNPSRKLSIYPNPSKTLWHIFNRILEILWKSLLTLDFLIKL